MLYPENIFENQVSCSIGATTQISKMYSYRKLKTDRKNKSFLDFQIGLAMGMKRYSKKEKSRK